MHFKFDKTEITLFEAFSGIGTQAMALKRLAKELNFDLRAIGTSEIDKYAIKSYNAIHGQTNNFGSITDIQEIPQVDIFTYSFPCTDISNAGLRKGFGKGSGTRSGLLWEVERILINQAKVGKLPKVLLLENVKALVNKNFKEGFDEWLAALESMGYKNYWKVLNSKDYGIAQNRERVFVVSILGDYEYEFPKAFELTRKLKDFLEVAVDPKFDLTEKQMVALQRGNFESMRMDRVNNIEEDTIKTITAVCGGHQEPKISYAPSSREFKDGGWKDIAPTLMARDYKDPKMIQEDLKIRKLTPREAWRLMGISDEDFDKAQAVNSNSQLYKQAGNAIVVDVLYYIFKQLF